MHIWLILIGASALVGCLTAIYVKKDWAMYVAGAVPWFGLLAAILYIEYFTPYKGGGASMWPIAQFFGGIVAAAIGILSFEAVSKFRNRGNGGG